MWSGEFPCKRKDGSFVDTMVTNIPIMDAQGGVAAIIGASVDVNSAIPGIWRASSDGATKLKGGGEGMALSGSGDLGRGKGSPSGSPASLSMQVGSSS